MNPEANSAESVDPPSANPLLSAPDAYTPPQRLSPPSTTPLLSPRGSTEVTPTNDILPSSGKTATKDVTPAGKVQAPESAVKEKQGAPELVVQEAALESMTQEKKAVPEPMP